MIWPQCCVLENSRLTPKMAKNCQNLAILGQNSYFLSVFGLYLHNTSINFHNFWYGNYPCGLLWENHTLYAEKILIWRNFGHLRPKFGHFLAKNWQYWEFLTYNFQTPLWIFLIFSMKIVLMVLFEKIILYMPRKFWYGEILAI